MEKSIEIKLQHKLHPQLQFHFEDRIKYCNTSIIKINNRSWQSNFIDPI